MSEIDRLLSNAREYASAEDGYPPSATVVPGRHLAVVACMDARLDVTRMLGIREGDVHVIRNAGGIVTDDVIRSLAASQNLLETTDVMVIQHTDCGLSKTDDDDFRQLLEQRAGQTPDWELGAFSDTEASVRSSLDRLEQCPFLPAEGELRGFIFDVESGELREVERQG